MPENRSDKSLFKSRFGGGFLSKGQWLAESMCDRKARKDGKVLGLKFWQKEPWKREFLLQIRMANGLLKLYSVEAILRALRSPKGKNIYSLGAPWLDPLVREEHIKFEREIEKLTKCGEAAVSEERPVVVEKPREGFVGRDSPLNKLRKLDG